MAELTGRLMVIARMLAGSTVVVDVGSDHGKLACVLIQEYGMERVIATDISWHSIEKIKLQAAKNGVSDRLEARQGNGLEPIGGQEAGCGIVLAGLGGEVIASILRAQEQKARAARLLVLQPMSDAGHLRQYLTENGFVITDDQLVKDAGRIYQVIAAAGEGQSPAPAPDFWPEEFYELSHLPFLAGDPLFLELLERKIRIYQKAYEGGKTKKLQHTLESLLKIRWSAQPT